ncbi:MAG: DoxX family protein [Hyphomicrobiales bacterium]|jgi:putative oxidoreductase|uniref:DoxX family protein n=1 Tax=Rhabdaerophilum calidifontis TaxID=2604328 RepID=UPI00123AF047|nr:DoxX family protein [Rhabdaerophilum calidifontis]MCA1953048.1 DoxX family protein [Hyphomicrobiales bacterium]
MSLPPALSNLILLAARLMLALMFVLSGYSKIGGYAGTQKYMEAFGVPGALLPLVIIVELIGGAMVMVGFQTRLAALALAGFTLAAALLFHFKLADQMQFLLFMKNISVTGGFLALAVAGPGAFSVDRR